MPYIVGLTGGIGSGKTTVANCFAERGVHLIDTDEIARALTAQGGESIPEIAAAFGKALLTPTGALNRVVMRTRIFAHPAERRRLEAILHPRIHAHAIAACDNAPGPYSMLIVPLLAEFSGHYRPLCQRILVVDCPENLQKQRLMQRGGLSAEVAQQMMAAQASREERLKMADDMILNTASIPDLQASVESLHRQYLAYLTV